MAAAHRGGTIRSERRWTTARKWIWTSIAIASMWISVLFASVFGGDIVVESAVDRVTTPMGVVVAVCALVASIVAAAFGFRETRR